MNKIKLTVMGLLLAPVMEAHPQTTPVTAPELATALATELDWIAGHWCMDKGTEHIEEQWLPARGGLLLGMGRTVTAGRARSFEFLRIETHSGKPVLIAQPGGVPPTLFALTASGQGWARFENPQHDFPKRVEYRRTAQGLHAEIAGPGEGGQETVIPFDYQSCK
jgi:Domain of unknown function (DUF6265)